jgi:hypothetical protein
MLLLIFAPTIFENARLCAEEGMPCLVNEDCLVPLEFCEKPLGQCDGEGVCTEIPTDIGCLAVWDPVCGCDGKTHSNGCYALKAGVSIDYEGACDEPCDGDFDSDGDVDGKDLQRFAEHFGRGNCLEAARLEEYSNSGCVTGSEVDVSKGQYPWCGEDGFQISAFDGILSVAHKNATYNCCPADIEVSLNVQGSILIMIEKEILPAPCDCLCCYEVKSRIVNLSGGRYLFIYCWDDYEKGQLQCHAERIVVP